MSDEAKRDQQREAANRAAREIAGAAVDGGNVVPFTPGAGDSGGPTEKEPLYVRVPCEGHQLYKFAHEVGQILKTNGVFRRENLPVTINRETGGMEVMSANRFRTYIERYMIPAKFVWSKDDPTPRKIAQTIGREVAIGTLESPFFIDQQRPLRRVNAERMPVMRKDGRVELLKPGYDPEAQIFTMHSALEIDETMSAKDARLVIENMLREFPFGDFKEDNDANRAAGVVGLSRSKAVHVALMVSMFGSGLLSDLANRLHGVYVANAQRSGKTLLAKTGLVTIFGAPARTTTLPRDDNELRKKLTMAALSNAPYFFLDDLEGMLKSQDLNAFMTSPGWSDRKMASHDEMVAQKQTVVIITGNNLSLSTDIANRTLRCHLYTEEADAQARNIENVIDEEYLARSDVRRKVLSALWAFIREWDAAGRPRKVRVLKGFESWCHLFGGIVQHAGFGDPIEPPPQDDYSGDTEGADMFTLVKALVEDMGLETRKEFEFSELVDAARANDCFSWMMDGRERTVKKGDEEWQEFDLKQGAKSALGKMFTAKYGGRKFRLPDGRVVQFGKRGRNRHRKYLVEIQHPTKGSTS